MAQRTIFRGGQVFDGTSAIAAGDVVVEEGVIVDVGPGLDGDVAVDCVGKVVLPGLFDCHIHVMMSTLDLMRRIQTPFSYRFFQAVENLEKVLGLGITSVR